jgi:hypothetical protein
MAYRFLEAGSEGRKNLKFGYSSQPRGHRQLHEGKIRLTVENGEFLSNYLEGRLPNFIVSKDTLPYRGVDHTTFCISTFNRDELETFIKAVEITAIWALRQEADRKEQAHKDRWEPQPFAWENHVTVKFDDDDSLPF